MGPFGLRLGPFGAYRGPRPAGLNRRQVQIQMLAYHPLTGKEIRVIQTEASMWKSARTLVFGSPSRFFDTITVGDTEGAATYIIQISPVTAIQLKAMSQKARLLFVSNAAIRGVGQEAMKRLGITNVTGLDELHLLYPYLGAAWDGTAPDAVVIVAALMRYRRLSGVQAAIASIAPRASLVGVELVTVSEPRLWWVTQTYVPKDAQRAQEISTCLERNLASTLIERVVLLNEKKGLHSAAGARAADERIIGTRLTYKKVLEVAATFPPDVIVVFANADICIDDATWRQLCEVDLTDKFLALLRYDVPASGRTEDATLFGPRADSQDTWVVRVADLQKRPLAVPAALATLDFPFGRMGCDNIVALEMLRQKFTVVNPALSLKTWHFHASGKRNYDKNDVIERPTFHYVVPSGFHDLEPTFRLDGAESLDPITLLRHVKGPGATTWMSAYNRTLKGDAFKLEDANQVNPSRELVVRCNNCFQTETGLAFDRTRLLIGPAKAAQKVWAKAEMSALTPTLECKRGLIVPWAATGSPPTREEYILHYLSKVLRIGGGAATIAAEGWEFFCPEQKEVVEALENFSWNSKRLPVMKHEPDILVWCSEALVMPVSDNTCVLAEDVEALRGSCKGWQGAAAAAAAAPTEGQKPTIVLVEGGLMTAQLVEATEAALEAHFTVKVVYAGRTSVYRMMNVMADAGAVVCAGGLQAAGWNWLLPAGSQVFELVGADAPSKAALELSSAAGLDHQFVTAKTLVEAVLGLQQTPQTPFTQNTEATLPLILVPSAHQGYFAHPGDSFREMVRLWAAAGLCRIQEHSATMVWWGSVGPEGVLLYDRPNHDWRLAAPAAEKNARLTLVGNPKPAAETHQPWFFWPRRPELVEAAAVTVPPYEARKGTVFYGKIENRVQEKRRTQADWSLACDVWAMAKGDEPHLFTQDEYLQGLREARFGLCLAGYGNKCHREVECMAMGCVPLCAPEVDMDSYASPPVEGIHYIRVKTPEEARAASKMPQEKWQRMHEAGRKWWQENCSCEGSFRLTKRLVDAAEAPPNP